MARPKKVARKVHETQSEHYGLIEYPLHLPASARWETVRLPESDEYYGPVTVTDGSGATIRVIPVEELDRRAKVVHNPVKALSLAPKRLEPWWRGLNKGD